MTQKEAQWIRVREIAKIAESILQNDILDKKKIQELDVEVSAMLRHLSSSKRFFKRLS